MAENKVVVNGGINFLGLLGILFIGLKLTGYIDWSWWYVLLPLYGGLALVIAFGVFMGIIYGIGCLIDKAHKNKIYDE